MKITFNKVSMIFEKNFWINLAQKVDSFRIKKPIKFYPIVCLASLTPLLLFLIFYSPAKTSSLPTETMVVGIRTAPLGAKPTTFIDTRGNGIPAGSTTNPNRPKPAVE